MQYECYVWSEWSEQITFKTPNGRCRNELKHAMKWRIALAHGNPFKSFDIGGWMTRCLDVWAFDQWFVFVCIRTLRGLRSRWNVQKNIPIKQWSKKSNNNNNSTMKYIDDKKKTDDRRRENGARIDGKAAKSIIAAYKPLNFHSGHNNILRMLKQHHLYANAIIRFLRAVAILVDRFSP